jgi:hypothetical protein
MNRYNINLDKYKKMVRKEYPFLPKEEADELTEELYSFLERWFLLEIE